MLACCFIGACFTGPSDEERLRARQEALQAACPLGSSLEHVRGILKQQAVPGFAVTSPAECQKYAEMFNEPETCAGGSRITALVPIARDWTGFETLLLITYLFDLQEKLAVAKYEPRYSWF
jgi:hypothetical protein